MGPIVAACATIFFRTFSGISVTGGLKQQAVRLNNFTRSFAKMDVNHRSITHQLETLFTDESLRFDGHLSKSFDEHGFCDALHIATHTKVRQMPEAYVGLYCLLSLWHAHIRARAYVPECAHVCISSRTPRHKTIAQAQKDISLSLSVSLPLSFSLFLP